MKLDKSTVKYLNHQPCFTCRYSQIDQSDFGLRCCNSDCEYCTEYCPDATCKHYTTEEFCEECKWMQFDILLGTERCLNSNSPFFGYCSPKRACEFHKKKKAKGKKDEED